MKRDPQLARDILLQIEERSDGITIMDLTFPDRSSEEVSYQVMIMAQGGLIEARDFSDPVGLDWRPRTLTWEGHEFLDAVRNESVWKKIKQAATEKGGGIAFEVLKTLAIKYSTALFTS